MRMLTVALCFQLALSPVLIISCEYNWMLNIKFYMLSPFLWCPIEAIIKAKELCVTNWFQDHISQLILIFPTLQFGVHTMKWALLTLSDGSLAFSQSHLLFNFNDLHSRLRHSWQLLANHHTCDQKIVIHGNSCIVLYIYTLDARRLTHKYFQHLRRYIIVTRFNGERFELWN